VSQKQKINNPNYPDFWDQKYILNESKWDIGFPTPVFVDWFNKNNKKKKILVPGCGSGHDALFLASRGHDVYALDFSIEAIKSISKKADLENIHINILHKSIFDMENYYQKFDIILEYTFFCAINPIDRFKYIETAYNLLVDKGLFIGMLLPIQKPLNEGGPPFGVDLSETISMFEKYFKLIECSDPKLSIIPRSGNEKFIQMKKCVR
jgi:SAM-dependent methyltransferase